MKYYLLAACAVLAVGAVMLVASFRGETLDAHEQWRQSAVEPEARVRPAYFEDMRWTPEASVELRAPASKKAK